MGMCPQTLVVRTTSERIKLRVGKWCREMAGRILEFLHSPARLKEFEYVDPVTNDTVYLSTGTRYSVLHVGDKRYFFDRVTGRFDGTGTLLQKRVVSRLQLLD
jgi:hypothetical protein